MYAFIHQGTNFTGALDYILDSHGVNNKIVQLLGSEGVDVPTDKDAYWMQMQWLSAFAYRPL